MAHEQTRTPPEGVPTGDPTVPDLIAPNLLVLFCGINPSPHSTTLGHHFAGPGNRFWRIMYAAGFTQRLLHPTEEQSLLAAGYGITSLVARPTRRAADLAPHELVAGRQYLQAKVALYCPRIVAFLGIGAYRIAFSQSQAQIGRQAVTLAGAEVWVVPNPSGLNRHYTNEALTQIYGQVRQAADALKRPD